MNGDHISSISIQPLVDSNTKLLDHMHRRWIMIVERELSDTPIELGRVIATFRTQIVHLIAFRDDEINYKKAINRPTKTQRKKCLIKITQ